ncbi:hypothetical protein T484DRAFT_2111741 [Baffinella frigidus]|nr:hypothetical protein T484DRAFT_2111741 [Cryptophyta sp. CCMP2293]
MAGPVEAFLGEKGGVFACGESFSLADVALVPGIMRLETEAVILDPTSPLIRARPDLPNLARWLDAMETRVSSLQSRVGTDPLSRALLMANSVEAGEKPEVAQGAARAVASLASAQDWRLVLAEAVPPPWTNFARRYPSVAKTPKLEAAAFLVASKQSVVAALAAKTPEIFHGASRPRQDSESGLESRPDLAVRLVVTALADAPDYGSSPTFANTFLSTLISDLSTDALREVSECLAELRCGSVLLAPRDIGPEPLRILRAHAAWVAIQVAKALKKRAPAEPVEKAKNKW